LNRVPILLALTLFSVTRSAVAGDWPMWGRDPSRNLVSPEKNAPTDWQVPTNDDMGVVRPARHIKWSAELGSMCTSAPVVANGLVWMGTNNRSPRDPNRKEDASVLMCFRESDGKFLWQYLSPRLRNASHAEDFPYHCMGSTPLVEGDRLYLLTNRTEALCLDIGPLLRGDGEPREDWKVDLRKEFKVVPHAPMMAMGFSPSFAAYKDWVYVITGNGVGDDHVTLPAPEAPSLVCLEKGTGKLVWKDNSPGKGILHCQRSTPLVVEVNGRGQVIVGQGDGWLRSFEPATGALMWKCDLNRKDSKYDLGGRGGRNYVMATPVYAEGRVWIAPGQDPEHYEGEGCLYCIDPTKRGDVSMDLQEKAGPIKPNPNSAGLLPKAEADKWDRDYYYGRTLSNCVVQDGLVYATEIAGYMYCFDAKTGQFRWRHDLRSSVWGSPLWVDGKVYIATEDGDVWIFAHGKEKKIVRKVAMEYPVRATPIFANGVLYMPAENRLYAIQERK
jgi:outer membrane protein assembly factor BamB